MPDDTFLILHGEDDSADEEFMRRTLKGMEYEGNYLCLHVGQDILDYVYRQGRFEHETTSLPDLIILDIGLPGINGKELIGQLRSEDSTKHLPIIIMSGSVSERDFHECINLGCNAYIQKNESMKLVKQICKSSIETWMNISKQQFL